MPSASTNSRPNVVSLTAGLAALADLTPAADKLPYFTSSIAAANATFTAAARTVLDDATVAAMLNTLFAQTLPLASASQAAVVLGNADNDIGGLSINTGTIAVDTQALRDKCEILADDVRALSVLVHALRTALVTLTLAKGSA